VVNEQLLGAQSALVAAQAEQANAESKIAIADTALRAAQVKQEQFRGTVDALTAASYQGARLNRLSAVLISQSPQDLIDRMSGLDLLATDTTARVQAFTAAAADAVVAKTAAATAAAAAQASAAAAAGEEATLQSKQGELATQIKAVRAQYATLTQAQKASYAGSLTPVDFVSPVAPAAPAVPVTPAAPAAPAAPAPPDTAPASSAMPAPAPGSSVGTRALQFAMGKLGSAYSWGAAGPDRFDCSGLTSWSFRQSGLAIPRTAGAQAGSGAPVSRDALQPGDLVFFYSPITHVGIYAGNGNVVHALTEGQPVKVSPMSTMPYITARRY